MGKNKIIKKQSKKIERLEKELADRCKDVKNLIENPEGLASIEAKFNYNVGKQFDNFNLVAGRQPDLNKTGGGFLYDHLAENKVDLHKDFLGLPEHWYIQVTSDNKEILTDYLKNHKQRYEQFSEHWYASFQCGQVSFFHSDSKEAGHSTLQPRNGYTEVTTEMVKNYMKTWHNINSLVDKDWIQFKANKDGATGNTPIYSPEHLEAKKALFDSNNVNKDNMKLELSEEDKKAIVECINEKKEILKLKRDFYDKYFKETVDKAFEARIHKVPDRWVVVKVKEGSIIIPPGTETQILVKGMPIPDHIGVGDFKKRADALEKCTDQECKPIEELPKTLESLDKIYSFIGLREKSAITNGNKDIIFMKTNNYLNSGRVGYFNTQKPNLMYSPFEMLSDWKSNYVKPLD